MYYDHMWATLAGTPGLQGNTDGPAVTALFSLPSGVALDAAGNLYVADSEGALALLGDTIRIVTPAHLVRTLAGNPGRCGSVDGTGSAAQFCNPQGVAVDAAGNLYVADRDNSTIRTITPSGEVTTLAGSLSPYGLALDGATNVYVADYLNNTIRKVTPAGVVSTLAGSPGAQGSADGTGSAARFSGPSGVAVDRAGNVLVVDSQNYMIRKITPDGVVTTLAHNVGGGVLRFDGVAVDIAGNVYVANANNTISRITPAGLVTTLAGSPGQTGSADGPSSVVRFNQPAGLAINDQGTVYVADRLNFRIVKGVPPAPPSFTAGAYAMQALPNQPNSSSVLKLLQACTASQGDFLTISGVAAASSQGGSVQLRDSTITYTPPAGFTGTDSFSYTVSDSRSASAQGTVIVTVTAGATGPTLAITLLPNNSVVIRVAGLPGRTYNIEASTDLVQWSQVYASSTGTNAWFEFVDTVTNISQARYYRARAP